MIGNLQTNNSFSNDKEKTGLKNQLIRFFFVFYPIKPFQSINLMVIMGLFLALKLILAKLSIALPGFGTRIAFTWTAIMVAGWFFGPFYGLIFGIIADTVGFLLSPGVWYWPYAIQEPTVGLVAGLMGSWLRIFEDKFPLKTHLIINQSFILVFIIAVISGLLFWTFKSQSNQGQKNISSIKYLAIGLLLLYVLISESAIGYCYWKKKPFLLIYLYASVVVISLILFWSFLLGPVIAINYYYYRTGRLPEMIEKYGPIIYLIPRMLRESIKTPIQIVMMTLIIMAVNPIFENIYNRLENCHNLKKQKIWLTIYPRQRIGWRPRLFSCLKSKNIKFIPFNQYSQ